MSNHLWSPSTGHFYRADVYGDGIPADALAITDHRYRELLDGQGQGRKIRAGKSGKPELTPAPRATRELLLKRAIADIKVQARRRILAVASLERQSNDNALMAIATANPADLAAAHARRAGSMRCAPLPTWSKPQSPIGHRPPLPLSMLALPLGGPNGVTDEGIRPSRNRNAGRHRAGRRRGRKRRCKAYQSARMGDGAACRGENGCAQCDRQCADDGDGGYQCPNHDRAKLRRLGVRVGDSSGDECGQHLRCQCC
jgi:hypothetical protein